MNRRATKYFPMHRKLGALLLLALGACGPAAENGPVDETDSPLTVINNNVGLSATPNPWELRATWSDYPDETSYSLYGNTNQTPGPLFVAGPGGAGSQLGLGWWLITHLGANTTSHTFGSQFETTVAVCAFDGYATSGTVMDCRGSARVRPTPLDYATLENLRVSVRSKSHLRVKWNQSSNTFASRATITPQHGAVSPVLNDADQAINFEGLRPNTSYTVEVCVQSQQDVTRDKRSCKTITEKTLPETPRSVQSLEVDGITHSSATVRFVHENRQESGLLGFKVEIIKAGGGEIVMTIDVPPQSVGVRTYSVNFAGLLPFTQYRLTVKPYNANEQGPGEGIAFKTDARVEVSPIGLSANSVLLRFNAIAEGTYSVSKQSPLGPWIKVGKVDIAAPQLVNIVLDDVTAAQPIRVVWTLGTAESATTIMVTPLAAGTPELISTKAITLFGGVTLNMKKMTAVFMPTISDVSEYVIQGQPALTSSWTTLRTTPKQSFTAGVRATYSVDTPLVYTSYRACRMAPGRLGPVPQCSANISTAAMTRFSLAYNFRFDFR